MWLTPDVLTSEALMSRPVKWRYKSPSCTDTSMKTDDQCIFTWYLLCLHSLGSCCLGPWLRKRGWSLVPRRSRASWSTHSFVSLGKTTHLSFQGCTKHEIILQGVTAGLVSSGCWSCLALVEIQGREVSEEKAERQRCSIKLTNYLIHFL